MALLLLAWPIVHAGCETVDGGAVEVSWDLRGEDGTDRNCAEANVDRIKLEWDGPREASQDDFRCEDARGITGFKIGAGEVRLWLVPLCEGGSEAVAGFQAPAEIVRTITEGEVITLTTQIIDVKVTDCTAENPCVCP